MFRFVFSPILLGIFLWVGCNPTEKPKTTVEKDNNPVSGDYDHVLAKRLGADEYGMKRYVMAFLKKGKTQIKDSTERAQLQLKHLQNIQRLAKEGKLVVAGPFLDGKDATWRGIFVFNVESVEEAQKLTETDPAIQAGTLEMELHPWYCSASLVDVPNIHKKLEKKGITEAK
jgi:uncharacterized protein YciI